MRSSPETLASEAPALGRLKDAPIRVLLAVPDTVSSALICSLLEGEPNVTLERVDESGLASSIHECTPDLVILDAHALKIRGAERRENLGIKSPPSTVLTTYNSISASPFASSVSDLLIKPVDSKHLQAAPDHAKSRIVRTRIEHQTNDGRTERESTPTQFLQRLAIEEDEKIVLLRTADIEWMQSSGNYVRLHVGNTCHLFRQTLKSLQAQLDPRSFLRVHRNAIVNLDHVEEFHLPPSGNMFVRMHNGACLPLRKSSRTLLRKMLVKIS